MEMAAGSYVLGMTSVADTPEGMQRLHSALLENRPKYSVEGRQK